VVGESSAQEAGATTQPQRDVNDSFTLIQTTLDPQIQTHPQIPTTTPWRISIPRRERSLGQTSKI
jgi:hypothetical protein